MKKVSVILYFILHALLGISILLLIIFESKYIEILHATIYISIIMLYIYIAFKSNNKATILIVASYVIYYYQVPFVDYYLPNSSTEEYIVLLNHNTKVRLFILYYYISILFIIPILATSKVDLNFDYLINHQLLLKYIFIISTIASMFFIIYMFINSGGLQNYLSLNKFEKADISKLSFFSYKTFAILSVASGLLSNSNKIIKATYIFSALIIFLEIVSAKRFLVLTVIILFVLIRKTKLKFNAKTILLGVCLFIGMNLIKKIYYPIQNVLRGISDIEDIFYFTFSDFMRESLLIGEGNGHIRIIALIEEKGIEFPANNFINQLIASLPFSSNFSSYKTAGEFIRLSLGVEWSGLASSIYVVPYYSYNILGLLVIYLIISTIFKLFAKMLKIKKSPFFVLYFLINSPQLLFYFQREEIILIIKNLTLNFAVLSIVYFLGIACINLFSGNPKTSGMNTGRLFS